MMLLMPLRVEFTFDVLRYLTSSKTPVVVTDVWTGGQTERMKLFVPFPNLAKDHKSQF